MARNDKAAENIQLFRGSRTRKGVAEALLDKECCGTGQTIVQSDKLADVVHFDNALAHSNPTGANDKWFFPGSGLDFANSEVVNHINQYQVGAQISVLAIPTHAFVTGVTVTVLASEPGLTFQLVTRNGLVLPAATQIDVSVTAGADDCELTRTQSVGVITAPFGTLAEGQMQQVKIGRDGAGTFSLEADEIILEVVSMPTENAGKVVGLFKLDVAVSYDVIKRAER